MRIGYSCWGFLGDGITDTPDGSRAYRAAFLDELVAAGHDVVLLQANRDLLEAGGTPPGPYTWDLGFPRLDALVLEWRWPLPGRNTTSCGTAGHTCDLHRQTALVDAYTRRIGLPTIVWDLDRWLPADSDLRTLPQVAVAEYALADLPGVSRLLCPVPDRLLDAADPAALAAMPRDTQLVYVGNQYGRDPEFDRYFAPAAREVGHRVAGKWTDTARWPWVNFTGRAPFGDVAAIHAAALATVLLMPQRYAAVGHMSSRLGEALCAGCVPIIPADVVFAHRFLPADLHARDGADVVDIVTWLTRIAGTPAHAELIGGALTYLEPMRASRQAAVLTQILSALPQPPLGTTPQENR